MKVDPPMQDRRRRTLRSTW